MIKRITVRKRYFLLCLAFNILKSAQRKNGKRIRNNALAFVCQYVYLKKFGENMNAKVAANLAKKLFVSSPVNRKIPSPPRIENKKVIKRMIFPIDIPVVSEREARRIERAGGYEKGAQPKMDSGDVSHFA